MPDDLKPQQKEQIARLLGNAQIEIQGDEGETVANRQNDDYTARVEALLKQFGVRALPVPVDKIAKGLGAQLRYSPLDEELSGMIYISDDTPIIGVNSLHSPNRQRFLSRTRRLTWLCIVT